jgi:hypothetical protein
MSENSPNLVTLIKDEREKRAEAGHRMLSLWKTI